MRINRTAQYGVLFTLYLCRSGRATIEEAAANLQVSVSFLGQVAAKLCKAGTIRGVRGNGGGYELLGEPTIESVFDVLAPVSLLNPAETSYYAIGGAEHRALSQYVRSMKAALAPLLKRKVRSVGAELVANELAVMDRLVNSTTVN